MDYYPFNILSAKPIEVPATTENPAELRIMYWKLLSVKIIVTWEPDVDRRFAGVLKIKRGPKILHILEVLPNFDCQLFAIWKFSSQMTIENAFSN